MISLKNPVAPYADRSEYYQSARSVRGLRRRRFVARLRPLETIPRTSCRTRPSGMAPAEILNQTTVDGVQDGISFETCLIAILETKGCSARPSRLESNTPLPDSMDSILTTTTAEYLQDGRDRNILRDSEFRARFDDFGAPTDDGRRIQLLSCGCLVLCKFISKATRQIRQGQSNHVKCAASHVLLHPVGDSRPVIAMPRFPAGNRPRGRSPIPGHDTMSVRRVSVPRQRACPAFSSRSRPVRLLRAGHLDNLPLIRTFPGPE